MCINRYYRTQFETTGFSNTFVVYNNTFKIRFGGEEMAEEAKKMRTSAKTHFTRKQNEFLKSTNENKGIDTVKRTFAELNEAWNTVQGKHDIYTTHLTEEEVEQSESWITELHELYDEAADIQAQYVNKQIQIEKKQREEINQQEAISMEQERFQTLMQQITRKRNQWKQSLKITKHAQRLMESQSNDQENTSFAQDF